MSRKYIFQDKVGQPYNKPFPKSDQNNKADTHSPINLKDNSVLHIIVKFMTYRTNVFNFENFKKHPYRQFINLSRDDE